MLDDLIVQALANNWNAKIAAANVEAAAAVLTQARAPLFPQVSYNGQGLRERVSEDTATPVPAASPIPSNNFQLLAGASWEIDLWGRIRRQTEAARANLLATVEARRGVILSLVGTVASGYIQLLGLDEQLAIVEADPGRLWRIAAPVRAPVQIRPGLGDGRRPGQVPVRDRQRPDPDPGTQIAQTENALSMLLGRNPGPIPRGLTRRDPGPARRSPPGSRRTAGAPARTSSRRSSS